MSYYGFKPNPKQRVVNKAAAIFGKTAKIIVNGNRLSPLECRALDIAAGSYHVECFVDGQFVATASAKDWRKAYDKLVINVEECVKNKVQP